MKKKPTQSLTLCKRTISNLNQLHLRGGEQNTVGCPPVTKGDSIKIACCAGSFNASCDGQDSCLISCGGGSCFSCNETCQVSCFTNCGCLTNLPDAGCRR